MATQTLLSVLLLLSLLAISSTARPGRPFHPCHHTLILFSTSFPQNPQNPNLNNNNYNLHRSQSITLFITEIIPTVDSSSSYPSNSISTVNHHPRDEYDYDSLLYSSSLRDRTRDILSVVGSLLFGVGCGALTAAAMFLAWSLFAANRFYDDDDDSDDEFDSNEGADASPKKMGYVAVPASAAQEVV